MSKIDLSNWLMVLPARIGSQRLDRKPLQVLGGKPLIVRVWEKVEGLELFGAKVLVAIDSEEVADVLNKCRVPYVLTDSNLASGTDRVHAASLKFKQPFVMNIQGDEPFIEESDIKNLAVEFQKAAAEKFFKMGTLVFKSDDIHKFSQPQIVKTILNKNQTALYFSRAPIPFAREGGFDFFWQHLGIYAFTKSALQEFVNLPASRLELTEKLEQLRAVEAGWEIFASVAQTESWGIDTPEDLHLAESILRSRPKP